MAYAVPEVDNEEERRVALAVTRRWGGVVAELLAHARFELIVERQFIENMDVQLNRLKHVPALEAVERIRALQWKYRRALPPQSRPKLPPHDPIVREMEAAGVL